MSLRSFLQRRPLGRVLNQITVWLLILAMSDANSRTLAGGPVFHGATLLQLQGGSRYSPGSDPRPTQRDTPPLGRLSGVTSTSKFTGLPGTSARGSAARSPGFSRPGVTPPNLPESEGSTLAPTAQSRTSPDPAPAIGREAPDRGLSLVRSADASPQVGEPSGNRRPVPLVSGIPAPTPTTIAAKSTEFAKLSLPQLNLNRSTPSSLVGSPGLTPASPPRPSSLQLAQAGGLLSNDPEDSPCFALSARPKPGKVQLEWSSVAGAERYDIFRGADAEGVAFQKVGEAAGNLTLFLDSGVPNEVSYLYFVRALGGGTSCDSDVAAAHPTTRRGAPEYPPVIFSHAVTRGLAGATYQYHLRAADPYTPTAIQYSLVDGPAGMQVDPGTGWVQWLASPGTYPITLAATDMVGGTDQQSYLLEVTQPNQRPIARAGADQPGRVNTRVTLDGSGSSDSDGNDLAFSWLIVQQPNNGGAILDDPTSPTPSFVSKALGIYRLQLIVNDGLLDSEPDLVEVSVENRAPAAEAGGPQTVGLDTTVQLDGSASTDLDGDVLTYSWSFESIPPGSRAKLSNAKAVRPTFQADRRGDFVVRLVVNDGYVESAPDRVTITTTNSIPLANAGPDQTAPRLATVTLDGTRSSDPDHDVLTYRWVVTHQPAGSDLRLSDPAASKPTFQIQVSGDYRFELVVNDGFADSLPDTVVISTENSRPVANAGADQEVTAGSLVQLDGTASQDADQDALTYFWSMIERPGVGIPEVFDDPTSPTPKFPTGPEGLYIAQLIVSDGKANSEPDTVVITAVKRQVAVPNVVGMLKVQAESTILNATLTVGPISTAHNAVVPAGQVISQTPVAETLVDPGSAVAMVVSLGPVLIAVPDVVGMPEAEADQKITRAKLTVGDLTRRHHPTVAAGHVISQNPVGGTLVTLGTPVHLELSLGPETNCAFTPAEFAQWTQRISAPPAGESAGTIRLADAPECGMVLVEGDSFEVAAERTYTIPAGTGMLEIEYETPTFDTMTTGAIRDAFEIAVVDASGRSLTFTVQGQAGTLPADGSQPTPLPPSPDALFNHADGSLPFLAPGTASYTAGARNVVAIDVRGVGASPRLIVRLVNNDRDRNTTVRVREVRFAPFDAGRDFTGSAGTALSTLLGSGSSVTSSCTDSSFAVGASAVSPKVVLGNLPVGPGGFAAPELTVTRPYDQTSAPVGPILLTGYARADHPGQSPGVLAANAIHSVSLNGQPVAALDVAGNFFAKVALVPGANDLELIAVDNQGLTTTNSITVFGSTCTERLADLGEVSTTLEPVYGRTSYNDWTQVLDAELALYNAGGIPVGAPVYVGVTRVSDPTVQLLLPDGVTSDGVPFYDFSGALPAQTLAAGEMSLPRSLAFSNPNRVQFSYDLVVLGRLNRPPEFTSIPVLEAAVGKSYAYDADALDPDADTVSYHIVQAPSGMTIDPATGRISFRPTSAQKGTHQIVLRADDGHGGSSTQTYSLTVDDPPPNRPPYFVSTPVVEATLGKPYRYAAQATDPDGDSLIYSIRRGPAGIRIDPGTGMLSWAPQATAMRYEITQTLGDADFFGFGGGTLGQPVPRIEFDNRSVSDPLFTDHDARFRRVTRAEGDVTLAWEHDLSRQLARGTAISGRLDLAIGGIQDALRVGTDPGADDRLIIGGIESPAAFDDVDHSVPPGNQENGVGTSLISFFLSPAQLATVSRDGRMDVTLIGGFETFSGSRFNESYFIDYSTVMIQAEQPPASGRYEVELRAQDGHGGEARQTFEVSILGDPINHPPVIVSRPNSTATSGDLFTYDVDALDADQDPLRYTLLRGPYGMQIAPDTGVIQWDTTPRDGQFKSVLHFGGIGNEEVVNIQVDSRGNFYVAGLFQSSFGFDPGAAETIITTHGYYDVYVAKFSVDGSLAWVRSLGDKGLDQVWGMAIDRDGSVCLAGSFTGTPDFDPGSGIFPLSNRGMYDAFVWKLSGDGDFVWARSLGSMDFGGIDSANALCLDQDGNVLVTGRLRGQADFDPGPGERRLGTSGLEGAFVWKLNRDGALVWARVLGQEGSAYGTAIAVDGAGEIFLAGYFSGSATFGSDASRTTLQSAGGTDWFFMKLDRFGETQWVKRFGGPLDDDGESIVIDPDGNLVVAGYFYETGTSEASSPLFDVQSSGGADGAILKIDPFGKLIWGSRFGGLGDDPLYRLAIDCTGNLYANGYSTSPRITLGSAILPRVFENHGGRDAYVVKLAPNGELLWSTELGGTGKDDGFAIAVDPNGGVYFGGNFGDRVNFNPDGPEQELASVGGGDAFVVHAEASGACPTVQVQVSDGRGGFDEQAFDVLVSSARSNTPPRILEICDKSVEVGQSLRLTIGNPGLNAGELLMGAIPDKGKIVRLNLQTKQFSTLFETNLIHAGPTEGNFPNFAPRSLIVDREGWIMTHSPLSGTDLSISTGVRLNPYTLEYTEDSFSARPRFFRVLAQLGCEGYLVQRSSNSVLSVFNLQTGAERIVTRNFNVAEPGYVGVTLAHDPDGLPFVDDQRDVFITGDDGVYRVNLDSGSVSSLADSRVLGPGARGIAATKNGMLIAATGTSRLSKINPSNGEVTIINGNIGFLYGVAIAGDGAIYAVENYGTIRRVDESTGNYLDIATSSWIYPLFYVSELIAHGASDPDGDALSYDVVGLPLGATFDPVRREFNWKPIAADAGIHELQVHVSDGRGGHAQTTFAITVNPSNSVGQLDLTPSRVDREQMVVDPQTLIATGSVSVLVSNNGPDTLVVPVEVKVFEDSNGNGVFDAAVDAELGVGRLKDFLGPKASSSLAIGIDGIVSFPGAFVWAYVDSANQVAEADEANNVTRSTVSCQFVPPVGQLHPVVEWVRNSFKISPNSKQVINSPSVMDLNGDGLPEVIVITTVGNDVDGTLRALRGSDGGEVFTVSDFAGLINATGTPAVGDVDRDGHPDIIVVGSDRKALLAFDHDGHWKWTSDPLEVPLGLGGEAGTPALADLNGDGFSEIVIGREVLDRDGKLLWRGKGGRGEHEHTSGDPRRNGPGPISLIADIDLDGHPEVVAGNTVYRSDGSILWMNEVAGDGFAAVGNFDTDPEGEIALVASGNLWLFEHTGTAKWGPVSLEGGGLGGAPCIADVDGDGVPEIGVAGASNYTVFNADGTPKWSKKTQDASSNMTGSSVFDFDGDGSAEVVYRDEFTLRIYRGRDGHVLYETNMSSCTWTEYPLVVDVDGDGNAEIVVGANNFCRGAETGIYVLGDRSDTWVLTRKVWNQHTYHINNVNDDGTIPKHEEPSWLSHNTYRLNAQPAGLSPHAAPDLTTSFLRSSGSGGSLQWTARVGNQGEVVVGPGLLTAFYDGDLDSGGSLLAVAATTGWIEPGRFEDVSVVFSGSAPSSVWVVADDDGTGKGAVSECDEANNLYRGPHEIGGSALIRGSVFVDDDGNGRDWKVVELVENGDFSDGNTEFYSEYVYTPQVWSDSLYYIGTNPNHHHPSAASYGDHTTGDGLMMIINGSTTSGRVVWQQSVTTEAGQRHSLSMWLSSWNAAIPTRLRLSINGVQVGEDIQARAEAAVWRPYQFVWDSSKTGTALIQLTSLETSYGGNDYAIDDLSCTTRVGLEAGLPKWVVYLDSNRNGQRDVGEVWTVTDAAGDYSIQGLLPAAYSVRVEAKQGWEQTVPPSGEASVSLGDGETAREVDFGVRVAEPPNQPPEFVSTPVATSEVGKQYRYDCVALDPDADTVSFELLVHPDGMVMSPGAGVVRWVPSEAQLGSHPVVIRVRDGRGLFALQSFEIVVSSENRSPTITTVPLGPASVGTLWRYQVRAQDPDGDEIGYHLVIGPSGMSMDADGVVSWTPGIGQVGTHHVQVNAADVRGAGTTQSFDLPVVSSRQNHAPQITTRPRTLAAVGQPWLYEVSALDADGDALTFQLVSAPPGMTLEVAVPPSSNTRALNWLPSGAQLGSHAVKVQVSDGQATVTQEFAVEVRSQLQNRAPSIVSTPPSGAIIGRAYAYDVRASDPDNDALRWSLDTAPAGMSIDGMLGTLRWVPTAAALGTQTVAVRATDSQGAFATQTYTLTVRAANLPPLITSTPPTEAAVGQGYSYVFRATDPEGGLLTLSLVAAPAGMALNPTNGLVEWTPVASQTGPQAVNLRAADAEGGSTEQAYTVVVSADAPNEPPVITSSPSFVALVGGGYQYPVTAVDPDGQSLTFSLLEQPAGMTIVPATGLVTWAPLAGQIGQHRVTVAAVDPLGAGGTQSYSLVVVADNHPPTITSSPVQRVAAGSLYGYDVRATDADGDALTYRLVTAPSGMTLDSLGRVRWATTLADAGLKPVVLTVSDPVGSSVTQSFNIQVTADTRAPVVRIAAADTRLPVGAILDIAAVATDDVGVASLVVTYAGTPIQLGADGRTQLELRSPGTFTIAAIATDAAGNVGQDSFELEIFTPVVDPTDPVVEITAPAMDAAITARVPILGTASDANLANYKLTVRPLAGGAETQIGGGTTSVVNGTLGLLDPTLLANDSYELTLTATDAGGRSTSISQIFHVAGELKVGNFRLSFTDLSIPVTGVPIVVGRTYDTLDANRTGDFGFGWRLEFRDARLRTSVPKGEYLEDEFGDVAFSVTPFTERTRVYVTLPGGKREGFTFKPRRRSGFSGFLAFYDAEFVADGGNTANLSVLSDFANNALIADDFGSFYILSGPGGSAVPYNPEDVSLRTTYVITTREGLAYSLDPRTGHMQQVVDPNGNTLTFQENAIVSSTGVRISFVRDAQGRITRVTDPSGKSLEYRYDAQGDLVEMKDRELNATQFVYSPLHAHYLERVIDPLGRIGVRTDYDAQGRLIRLVDAAGNPVELLHNLDDSIEQVVDALGHTNTFVYDERGNVIQEINALGAVTLRQYDGNNYLTHEVDALGNAQSYVYDALGNVLEHTDPLGRKTISSYVTFRPGLFARVRGYRPMTLLRTTVDPLGRVTENTYEMTGDLYNAGSNLIATKDTAGRIRRYAYDGSGNQTSITDPAGNVTSFQYDGAGRLLQQVDPVGHVTSFTYDGNGNQLTQTTMVTANGVPVTVTSKTEYDANGRPTVVTDAMGNQTRTVYDKLGKTAATFDALGHKTEFIYDERGQLSETKFADGSFASTKYDKGGRRTESIDRAGRSTHFVYDDVGRLVQTIYPDDTPADPNDNPRTRTVYDLAGRVLEQINELGNSTRFGYDAAGRQTSVTNALNFVSRIEYDEAGRRVAESDPLGRTTRFLYQEDCCQSTETVFADGTSKKTIHDQLGRAAQEIDQVGVITAFGYDALGRLTSVTNAFGTSEELVTRYDYNEAGNLITQQDAEVRVTRYEYDALGRRTATILPMGERSSTVYNEVGGVKSTTDFNGHTIQFKYDNNNRLVRKEFRDGTAVEYTYTKSGRRETIRDARGLTTWAYDARDRLLSRTDPDGRQIAYTYDKAGNRLDIIAPSGVRGHTFDALNRLKTVTDPQGGVTEYFYDKANNIERVTNPNNTVRVNQYDALNRVTNIVHSGPAGVFASFGYTMSPTGNRLAVREFSVFQGVASTVTRTWGYDKLYRLAREEFSENGATTRLMTYTMDKVGNRLARGDTGEGTTTYAYNPNDELETETLNGVVTTYTYDANGNTLSRSNPTESTTYQWSDENRLIGATITVGGATKVLAYQYDDEGIRTDSSVTDGGNSTATAYLVDANRPFAQVQEEWTSFNGQSASLGGSYTHGHHQPILQDRSGVHSYYHGDHLGSTRALTGQIGSPTDLYSFDAYGRMLSEAGPTENAFQFTGEQRDLLNGLDYMRARYYHPNLGRLFGRDKYSGNPENPVTMHKFMYGNADPVHFVDPTGHFGLLSVLLATIAVSAVIAAISPQTLSGSDDFSRRSAIIAVPSQGYNAEDFLSSAIAVNWRVYSGRAHIIRSTVTLTGPNSSTVAFSTVYGNTQKPAYSFLMISHGFSADGPNLGFGLGDSADRYQPWRRELDSSGNWTLTSYAKAFWRSVGNTLHPGGKIVLLGCKMGIGYPSIGMRPYAEDVAKEAGRSVFGASEEFGSADAPIAIRTMKAIERGLPAPPMIEFK